MNAPFSELPDRRWIEGVYLPSLEGRVLYVGMDFYTAHYPAIATRSTLFQFLDSGDAATRYAHLGCIHADFCDHTPSEAYDHISLYGLAGFGSSAERMPELISHAHAILRVGGTLMLGPNKAIDENILPADFRDRLTDEIRAGLSGLLKAKSVEHWRTLFALPPLDRYTVLAEEASLPPMPTNYIWWGRKERQ